MGLKGKARREFNIKKGEKIAFLLKTRGKVDLLLFLPSPREENGGLNLWQRPQKVRRKGVIGWGVGKWKG